MNYQLRAKKQKSFFTQIIWVGFFTITCIFIVRALFPSVFTVFGAFLFAENSFLSSVQTNFADKQDLQKENKFLRSQLQENKIATDTVRANRQLVDSLYKNVRTQSDKVTIAEVLLRPPFSVYDTYIISAGSEVGIGKGQLVVAGGVNVLGYVDAVTETYARVQLFSSARQTQTISINGFLFDSVGQGGGIIEVRLPRNFADTQDQVVKLPGASNLIVGGVTVTQFDPQDSYVTGVVAPMVNIFSQDLVTVLEQKWEDVQALDLDQFNTISNEENTDTE